MNWLVSMVIWYSLTGLFLPAKVWEHTRHHLVNWPLTEVCVTFNSLTNKVVNIYDVTRMTSQMLSKSKCGKSCFLCFFFQMALKPLIKWHASGRQTYNNKVFHHYFLFLYFCVCFCFPEWIVRCTQYTSYWQSDLHCILL